VKQGTRTRTVSTKLSDEEFVQLESLSGSMTLSEWVREVLLMQRQAEPSPVELTLMGELMAIRTILLNVAYKLANNEQITFDIMQQLINRADEDKSQRASDILGKATRKCNLPTKPTTVK
jgi:hypothetical protein